MAHPIDALAQDADLNAEAVALEPSPQVPQPVPPTAIEPQLPNPIPPVAPAPAQSSGDSGQIQPPPAPTTEPAAVSDAKATEVNAATSSPESGSPGNEKVTNGSNVVEALLEARCAVAICFDNGGQPNWLGIEPLVELPVGSSFSITSSALSDYVNNHEIKVDLAAGARVWLFQDVISVALYISKPLNDGKIRLAGSPFVYPASSVRRPFPGIAVGLLYDTLWLGFDRDELRNGDGQDASALNPDFAPNAVISSSWTLTLALQPVTAFRTAIGTAVQSGKKAGGT
jgi:hypothetical protein